MTQQDSKLILVLGGTGKTGRRVVERLQARNLPVRIGSRAGNPSFDWNDRSTWAPALQGVYAVYIAYQPDLAVPNAAADIQAFTAQAVQAGVQRLVLLSGRGEEEAQRCEQIVQQAGVDWTIVRAAFFNQNFSESFFMEGIMAGQIALPVGDVKEPFVDTDDIADVAVAALTEEGHAGQVYELTGPRLITFAEAITEIAQAAQRDIHLVPVTIEQYTAYMRAEGIPDDYIWLVEYLFTHVLDGRNAYLTDGVQRALGRQPRDLSEYVRDTAQSGVWNVQPATANTLS